MFEQAAPLVSSQVRLPVYPISDIRRRSREGLCSNPEGQPIPTYPYPSLCDPCAMMP